jgi:hypothetical protein
MYNNAERLQLFGINLERERETLMLKQAVIYWEKSISKVAKVIYPLFK